MQIPTCLHAGVAATAIAVAGIAGPATAAAAPVTQARPTSTAAPDIQPPDTTIAPDAAVPPGGLVTSFLHNQLVYCSIICPLVVQAGVTAAVTTQQAPDTFRTASQSGDLLRAIGATVASVTGPTDAAAEAAILADGTEVAPRALNAFEVGVVGLLNVVPAAANGLPAVVTAARTARRDTFTALNAPIVPNPAPTVAPHGLVEVAVVAAIDVGAAVAFPAFNDVLSGVFRTPDAVARELAATGDPARAVAAGADAVTAVQTAASTVIAASIADAVDRIHTAAG
ncbi:hypothetical protein [Nocardia sp. alder85J]|uniref:hypothetical protein n=1 Tax=Nocardia sp. alder85J TaxID=2862949 RepID=UPI001CD3D5A7|nr:hypothetical protein [Nocardia sp. alder85J]MCX4095190.1 hypothetical protein [Nocardia sp. alder85J]